MDADVKSLLFNVLGGIIVSLLSFVYVVARHKLRAFHLQRLVGFSFKPNTEVRMIYGQLMLPQIRDSAGQPITHPYVKPPRRGPPPQQASYSMEHPVSECEVRAAAYIASLLGSPQGLHPMLMADADTVTLLDSTFVSFGGPGSNYKTADILASSANIFIQVSTSGFSLISGQALPYSCTNSVDYGFVLRLTPPELRGRSWIICAGLGEWGTSGSAWYLANRWQTLARTVHPFAYWLGLPAIPDFLAIVRVVSGQDQSTTVERIYRRAASGTVEVKYGQLAKQGA